MFQTKAELLGAIQDIIKIQMIAVEEQGILHHNCSLNNSMIEDDGNGVENEIPPGIDHAYFDSQQLV
ncbi:uncharacterized protein BJ212DRAFT_1476786 [Suillus subaureus]|uniref:Fungal-type protein kinase domain-containing protein n=1 Tax=Suillus subaureus TaxID=48587 RepID=A0A9P7JI55_9AGAM|nr:uncharacterized protein BJ212DRAFT_1476786 [Suillus subaureus]KAG1823933.1 hypothetical protein BJ212DRAFT_1476786 [Suillus subaureus]